MALAVSFRLWDARKLTAAFAVINSWWRVKLKPDSQDEEGPSGLVPAAYVELVSALTHLRGKLVFSLRRPLAHRQRTRPSLRLNTHTRRLKKVN